MSRGARRLRQPLSPVDIPATIQDSLMARLDRLGEAKWVAQVAATIGREFARELLAAVAEHARPASLQPRLSSLVKFGARPRARRLRQANSHSSIRSCAMPPTTACSAATRRTLHADIVEALERHFPPWSRPTRSWPRSTASRRRPTTRRLATGCRPAGTRSALGQRRGREPSRAWAAEPAQSAEGRDDRRPAAGAIWSRSAPPC